MDATLHRLAAAVAGLEAAVAAERADRRRRHAFAVELGRRGVFLRLGRHEVYCCAEREAAWSFTREPGGFDAWAGRLHLIVGRVPR